MPRILPLLLACVATTAYGASSVKFAADTLNTPPLSAIGVESTLTFGIQNAGDAANDIQLVYAMPPGMIYSASSFTTTPSTLTPPIDVTCSESAGSVTCNVPRLPAATVWINVNVLLSATVAEGTKLTHAATLTTPSDPSASGKSVSFTTTAAVAPTIEMSSSYPSSVVAGVPFTYMLTFRNSGTRPAPDLVFSDEPDGVFKAAVQSAGTPASCNDPVGDFIFQCHYALGPGESAAFAVTVKTDPNTPTYAATDTVTSYLLDFGLGHSATASAIATPLDDVAVTMTAPAQAQAGVDFPVRVAVSSAGPNLVRDITLTIPIPAGTTFAKLQQVSDIAGTPVANCTALQPGSGGTITCNLPYVVPPFGEATLPGVRYLFDVHLIAASVGSMTTTATVASAADVNPSNDTASGTTVIGNDAVADLALSMKTGSRLVTSSTADLEFRTTVVNNGPSPASNVVITNPLPAGATALSASCKGTPVVCTDGVASLAPGGVFISTMTFRVPTSMKSLTNQATVSSATADPVGGNNSASATASTAPITFTASVALADIYGHAQPLSSPVAPGASLFYFIDVTEGSAATLSIALPAGSVVTGTGPATGATINGTTVSFSAASAGRWFVAATAPPAPGHYTATVSAPGTSDASVTVPLDVVAGAAPLVTDLAVLVQPPAVAPPLEVARYVVSIVNRGPSPASNVRLSFTLPPRTTLDRIDAPAMTCNAAVLPIVCTARSLANGETMNADFFVRAGDVALGTALPATASVANDTLDADLGNDSATGAAIVGWPTELDLRVHPSDIAVTPGAQFTEVITVTNAGKAAVKTVQAGDSVGHGALQVLSQSAPGATCSGTTVLCVAPTLAPGAQMVITAVLKAPQSGTVTHTGYALSYGPDFGLQQFFTLLNVVVSPNPRRRSAGH